MQRRVNWGRKRSLDSLITLFCHVRAFVVHGPAGGRQGDIDLVMNGLPPAQGNRVRREYRLRAHPAVPGAADG